MEQFKSGQKVICIDASFRIELKQGETYEIGKAWSTIATDNPRFFVFVKEVPNRTFYARRFIAI